MRRIGASAHRRIGVGGADFTVNSQPALSQVLVKAENGVQTFYVYGLGLIGEDSAAGYRAYHFDLRGSTVALSDAAGAVTERFRYSAYGVLLAGDAAITPFLFNGMYGVMADGNGLYHMRARFYSAGIRRFLNRDILLGNLGRGQSMNRFAYTEGRVINYMDPFGTEVVPVINNPAMLKKFDIKLQDVIDLAFKQLRNNPNLRNHFNEYLGQKGYTLEDLLTGELLFEGKPLDCKFYLYSNNFNMGLTRWDGVFANEGVKGQSDKSIAMNVARLKYPWALSLQFWKNKEEKERMSTEYLRSAATTLIHELGHWAIEGFVRTEAFHDMEYGTDVIEPLIDWTCNNCQ